VISEVAKLSREELPRNFWWGDVNGTNFLTIQKNQHIPKYCGSCWSMAVTSSLSDRIKIKRNAVWPDINLAPQVLLSCDMNNHGCNGGNPPLAYQWIFQNNITDETCSPYQANGHDRTLGCSSDVKCKNCSSAGCSAQGKAKIYGIEEYGVITQK
jgi:cathepsin X